MFQLLIVTYHFPPSAASGSFRMLGFARHLPRFGWSVAVVAPPTIPWEPVDAGLLERVPRDTVVYPAPYPEGRLAWPLRKLYPEAAWWPWALRACGRALRAQRPEALLTSGPPHEVHWLGRHLKRRHGLAWLADFRDPWVTGRALGGLASKKRRTGRLSWERSVLREADAVVVNTPLVRELFREAYPEYAAKFTTVANGYDPEAFPPPAAAPTATRNGTPPVLLHAGELYLDRDPRPLFDALQTLQREGHPCRLRLLGRCNDPALDLEAEAQARGLAELELADQVPYHQALGAMAAADLLLLLDTPGRRVGVPAKLYEYLGAGRPVLALAEPDGDTARVLAESGLTHRVAPPRSAAAITQALRELLAARRASAATPDGSLGRLQFTREHQAGRLASLLDQTRGSGRRRSQ